MKQQVGKWGNSLAVRLPAECTKALGLREGDTVELELMPGGEIRLVPTRVLDRAAFVARLDKLHAKLPRTTTTVEAMREQERY